MANTKNITDRGERKAKKRALYLPRDYARHLFGSLERLTLTGRGLAAPSTQLELPLLRSLPHVERLTDARLP